LKLLYSSEYGNGRRCRAAPRRSLSRVSAHVSLLRGVCVPASVVIAMDGEIRDGKRVRVPRAVPAGDRPGIIRGGLR